MPRSRRRHHSRSRSRSRSQSHDREPKRRRLENAESPQIPKSSEDTESVLKNSQEVAAVTAVDVTPQEITDASSEVDITSKESENAAEVVADSDESDNESVTVVSSEDGDDKVPAVISQGTGDAAKVVGTPSSKNKTPQKTLTPGQLRKKLDSEKKAKLKQQAREERDRKKQEEREEKERKKQEEREEKEKKRLEEEKQKQKEKDEKQKQKEEKDEQRRLEREAKLKEKEDKKKEREEKEEQKRKEKEEKEKEKEQKKKEIEEKERRKKQLELEQKEKAALVFSKFFVPKKTTDSSNSSNTNEDKKEEVVAAFMPFNVKPDMRIAPTCRRLLSDNERDALTSYLEEQSDDTYLKDLKSGKAEKRKSSATWPVDDVKNDDVMILEENDESMIIAQDRKIQKQRAKMLKFHENRRPAYFGTWRKRSKTIRPKKPFVMDTSHFDYEVDSDDDWEDEGQGESLAGSDNEEDKENASENDYEEDNEFFVPHGYLSEGEGEDEDEDKIPMSPETHKAKLKLLKSSFEEEINSKTERLKPRLIGCVWESKEIDQVQDAFRNFLQQRAMITNGIIPIKKRELTLLQTPSNKKNATSEKKQKQLDRELIPAFLKLVHGNVKNQMFIVNEFLSYMVSKGLPNDISKSSLGRQLKTLATWMKCPEDGPLFNKYCWYVNEEVRQKYNVDVDLPNKWKYTASA